MIPHENYFREHKHLNLSHPNGHGIEGTKSGCLIADLVINLSQVISLATAPDSFRRAAAPCRSVSDPATRRLDSIHSKRCASDAS